MLTKNFYIYVCADSEPAVFLSADTNTKLKCDFKTCKWRVCFDGSAQTFGFLLQFLINFCFWNFNKITIINNFDAFLLLLLLLLLLNFSLLDPDPHSDWGSWSGRDPQPCRKMWLTLCGRWTRGSWPGCGTHSPQCTWCRRSRQETSPSDQTQMFLNNRNIEIQCLILVRSR